MNTNQSIIVRLDQLIRLLPKKQVIATPTVRQHTTISRNSHQRIFVIPATIQSASSGKNGNKNIIGKYIFDLTAIKSCAFFRVSSPTILTAIFSPPNLPIKNIAMLDKITPAKEIKNPFHAPNKIIDTIMKVILVAGTKHNNVVTNTCNNTNTTKLQLPQDEISYLNPSIEVIPKLLSVIHDNAEINTMHKIRITHLTQVFSFIDILVFNYNL